MSVTLGMFGAILFITLAITYWAAKRTRTTSDFYAADNRLSAAQNGFALAGDWCSAAAFLGFTGLTALYGMDGALYALGPLVAFCTVLLFIAEPLRNTGKYTLGDVILYRMQNRTSLLAAVSGTMLVNIAYLMPQMAGAGVLVKLLTGIPYNWAEVLVGASMIVYVAFGGMLATTWVQIVKAILLMGGTILLSILVLGHFGFSLSAFFNAVGHVTYHDAKGVEVVKDFMTPGLRYKPPYGALDLISLGIALIFGTAGLPHILVRFYTVPDAKTARHSVVWAMVLIGSFYIMTTFLGFGAATIVGQDYIKGHGGTNMSAPLLAQALAGDVFFAFISSIAFATILAVVAGLTISASTSFAHDFWTNVVHRGVERAPGEEVRVARIAAFVVGFVAMGIAILLGPSANVAFLVALAFAVASSANLPVIVLSIFWRRFNTMGAVMGLGVGLVASIGLILISPSFMGIDPPTVVGAARHPIQAVPIFKLENPAILSVPLGFIGAIIGTLLSKEPSAEEKFNELLVRSNTGLGAEKAVAH